MPSIAESIAWYEKRLGFKGTVRGSQPGARQQVADLRRGKITIELFQVADAAPLPESRIILAGLVDDAQIAVPLGGLVGKYGVDLVALERRLVA